ncbi:hypothetical protein [Aquimarina sp. SS2-1]|uniref:hypothetical protein n=1 Tax=Aquimarina besae TaxID=3342247 RepID=UPI00366F75E6
MSVKFLTAQETLKPFVDHYGDNLVLEGFPAISKDGTHYLVVYSQYVCCIVPEETLQKIDLKSGKILDEILLSRSQVEEQFTVQEQKEISEEVQQLLDSDSYTSFIEIEIFKPVYSKDKKMHIEVSILDRIYRSEEIVLSRIPSHGFCCNGGTDIEENCLLYQTIIAVYLSMEHKVLLIESGLDQMMDGCDQGPFYKVIPLVVD